MKSPLRIVGLLLFSISMALFAATFSVAFNNPLAFTIPLGQLEATLAFFGIAVVTLVAARKKADRPTDPAKSASL